MEDFYAHIEDYKLGLLEGELLEAFERQMAEDASLQLAVENFDVAKGISEALLEVDMMETLRGLKEAEKATKLSDDAVVREMERKTTGGRSAEKFNLSRWIVAASFVGVLVFAGWWVMDWKAEREFREFVLDNYEWPVDFDATKSVDTIDMNDFEKGKYYFKVNDFEQSLLFLQRHLAIEKEDQLLSQGYEWLGAVFTKMDKKEQAINALSRSNEQKAFVNLQLYDVNG
ncbi:MAG: hypothetical protein AAGA77_12745 [Bacteroidota bacterium]